MLLLVVSDREVRQFRHDVSIVALRVLYILCRRLDTEIVLYDHYYVNVLASPE